MRRFLIHLFIIVISVPSFGQPSINSKLAAAYNVFQNDSQLKSAISSLYIIDGKTGKVVFDKNSRIGLPTASTLKIITSATAYELLGQDFRYTTEFGYYGKQEDSVLNGSLFIKPSGDPTLGSWRWKNTNEESVLNRVLQAWKQTGIRRYNSIVVDVTGWESETIPGGWPWEDIGNYYGAGAEVLNWHENQYDLVLQSGNAVGERVTIKDTKPKLYSYSFTSFVTAAEKGTGDRTIIYFPSSSYNGIIRGTIPINENNFIVSGSIPSARKQLVATLSDSLGNSGIHSLLMPISKDATLNKEKNETEFTVLHKELSPPLDSIVYLFLKKSINLYGEALIKTLAFKSGKLASTDLGVKTIKDFWKSKLPSIDPQELHLDDGSGLSPLNRVTTHAQVEILRYAKKQTWFNGYYNAFPEYNNMKMKSGTIQGVKGFCGYHISKNGKEYIFSFLVNNYNGSASSLVNKMYKVLDVLK